ncbi:MAG: hypothetical protein IT350_13175 [Deltaproteobacteria bacterium]|nr:hypothetical protein [Deltaproteobacteria bacterium]
MTIVQTNDVFVDSDEKGRDIAIERLDTAKDIAIVRVRSAFDRYCAAYLTGKVEELAAQGVREFVLDLTEARSVYRLGIAEFSLRARAKSLDDRFSFVPQGNELDGVFEQLRWKRADLAALRTRPRRPLLATISAKTGSDQKPEARGFIPLSASEAFLPVPKPA